MPLDHLPRPQWLTFDCYSNLIQCDEGLQAAVARIFFNDTATTEIYTRTYTLSLHDALP
eukprot:COSAG04_NODE_28254_length_277_cov_0.561798_1_plen_58_part_10